MKSKLLRKLRKKYVIRERNKEYMVYDNGLKVERYSYWVDKKTAIKIRRDFILANARNNYKKPKKTW